MKLHTQALALAKDFKRVEVQLMDVLQRIDLSKEYRELGFGSLFEYVVHGLKLTEAQSYSLITVARKAKQVPMLQMAVESGEISVSQARRIVPVINQQNASLWINKVQSLPQRVIEKEVASLNPKEAVQERAKYVSAKRLKLELGVSEEFMRLLKRSQELLAQGNHQSPSMEEALEKTLRDFVQREDPIEKAKRKQSKPASRQVKVGQDSKVQTKLNASELNHSIVNSQEATSNEPNQNSSEFQSNHDFIEFDPKQSNVANRSNQKPIPLAVQNAVKLRDQGQCTFTRQGRRCTNRQWLHTHHLIPRSSGGTNNIENLNLLCATHHRYVHEELG